MEEFVCFGPHHSLTSLISRGFITQDDPITLTEVLLIVIIYLLCEQQCQPTNVLLPADISNY